MFNPRAVRQAKSFHLNPLMWYSSMSGESKLKGTHCRSHSHKAISKFPDANLIAGPRKSTRPSAVRF
jgi:hypothetical protein